MIEDMIIDHIWRFRLSVTAFCHNRLYGYDTLTDDVAYLKSKKRMH
jgi:hypothetical protein